MDTMHLLHRKHPIARSVVVILMGLAHLTLVGCVVGQDPVDCVKPMATLITEFPKNKNLFIDLNNDNINELSMVSDYIINLVEGPMNSAHAEVYISTSDSVEVTARKQRYRNNIHCHSMAVVGDGDILHAETKEGICWRSIGKSILATNANIQDSNIEWNFRYNDKNILIFGVRIKKDKGYNYGWFRIKMNPIESNLRLRVIVIDAFINPELNEPVVAGKCD